MIVEPSQPTIPKAACNQQKEIKSISKKPPFKRSKFNEQKPKNHNKKACTLKNKRTSVLCAGRAEKQDGARPAQATSARPAKPDSAPHAQPAALNRFDGPSMTLQPF